jgi:hypothetical protein
MKYEYNNKSKYKKFCIKCYLEINEDLDKYCMVITKTGRKIKEFECFHFKCWKDFLEENLRMLSKQ